MKNCQILRPSQLAVKARRLAAVLSLTVAPVLLVAQAPQFPNPAVDPPQRGEQTAVLAGGIPDRYSSDDVYVCFQLLSPRAPNPLEHLELVPDALRDAAGPVVATGRPAVATAPLAA